MTTMTTDATQLVENSIAIWNETDADTRKALVAATWTEDAAYTDPLTAVEGRAGIDGLAAAVQAEFPGFIFRRLGEADTHHEFIRFQWEAGPAGAPPIIAGSDVAVIQDGRLRRVIGFLDLLPETPA
ncbi:MAG: nuclear transport factor 2 family protein [Thermomicrobiales bacterium]|nr:nuclear transport factor 2 family protein [Thermomicrobiales bacterium]